MQLTAQVRRVKDRYAEEGERWGEERRRLEGREEEVRDAMASYMMESLKY